MFSRPRLFPGIPLLLVAARLMGGCIGDAPTPPKQGRCDVSVSNDTLSFGNTLVGDKSDPQTFVLTNHGEVALGGSVDLSNSDFEIVSGGGDYTLAPGSSLEISVRFTPQGAGARKSILNSGAVECADVTLVGTAASAGCDISPTGLDFSAVDMGQCSPAQSFTITNNGSSTLSGSISTSCADFEIVSGAGDFSIAPGGSQTISVRFCPQSASLKECTIETGIPICGSISVRGSGRSAACHVAPDSLAFGTVAPTECSATQSFVISNEGSTVIAGAVSESCPDFEITSGAGAYSLNPGGTRTVSVRFCPQSAGAKSCTIETGTTDCGGIVVSGTGGTAACSIMPPSLDFGTVASGQCSDPQTVTISNTGSAALSGSVSESCPDFEIVSGGGAYSIAPGGSRTVSVRFCPQSAGAKNCSISTGAAECAGISVQGTGSTTACNVSPGSLSFGSVETGLCSDVQSFGITNSGTTAISGTVSESCPDFEITAGGGAYSLNPGQGRSVSVRFCPQSAGVKNCTILTGAAACSDVSVSGTGVVTACNVSPSSLSFGSVNVSQCSNAQTITITNAGSTTLSGTVSESCPDFEIVTGLGAYSLGPGQSVAVSVRFCPQSTGAKNCTISTGLAACANVSASGTGTSTACDVSPSTLSFGSVPSGQCSDVQSFGITNSGTTAISGTVSESCPDFEITSGGGAYSLNPGQSRSVSVRFCPQSAGAKNCTISTGAAACSDVTVSGTGTAQEEAYLQIDFGTQEFSFTSNYWSGALYLIIDNNNAWQFADPAWDGCTTAGSLILQASTGKSVKIFPSKNKKAPLGLSINAASTGADVLLQVDSQNASATTLNEYTSVAGTCGNTSIPEDQSGNCFNPTVPFAKSCVTSGGPIQIVTQYTNVSGAAYAIQSIRYTFHGWLVPPGVVNTGHVTMVAG